MWVLKYSSLGDGIAPWAKEYDDDMFLNFVLPMTHFDEAADEWGALVRQNMDVKDLMAKKDTTLKQAAHYVTEHIWTAFEKPIEFKEEEPPILSVIEVMQKGHAGTAGLSIFLANALKAVGVPARVVGTAKWDRLQGGAYQWVEAYFDGKWNFIDAKPGTTEWNTAWFTEHGLAQKADPQSITQIATPVWNDELKTTDYHVTWDKKGKKEPKEVEGVKVYREFPAIDRTNWYKKRPEGKPDDHAEHAGAISLALSAFPLLAMVLAL